MVSAPDDLVAVAFTIIFTILYFDAMLYFLNNHSV